MELPTKVETSFIGCLTEYFLFFSIILIEFNRLVSVYYESDHPYWLACGWATKRQ